MTVTEGMAAATTTGTAAASHLDGIDFAGKTGTAQVVGGGDTHTKGGAKTPNAWFVGMVPRRNPELVVTVLQEHGDWGAGSAKLAAQVVAAYVNKKRKQEGNVLELAKTPAKVEMGAVWSAPDPEARLHRRGGGQVAPSPTQPGMTAVTGMTGGHFEIDTAASAEEAPSAPADARDILGRRPVRGPAKQEGRVDVALAMPERYRGVVEVAR
jgi:penicillin-binding protein 2